MSVFNAPTIRKEKTAEELFQKADLKIISTPKSQSRSGAGDLTSTPWELRASALATERC